MGGQPWGAQSCRHPWAALRGRGPPLPPCRGAASPCRAGWGARGTSARRDGHSLTGAGPVLPQFSLEMGQKESLGGGCQREDGKGRGVFAASAQGTPGLRIRLRFLTRRGTAVTVGITSGRGHKRARHVCVCAP